MFRYFPICFYCLHFSILNLYSLTGVKERSSLLVGPSSSSSGILFLLIHAVQGLCLIKQSLENKPIEYWQLKLIMPYFYEIFVLSFSIQFWCKNRPKFLHQSWICVLYRNHFFFWNNLSSWILLLHFWNINLFLHTNYRFV